MKIASLLCAVLFSAQSFANVCFTLEKEGTKNLPKEICVSKISDKRQLEIKTNKWGVQELFTTTDMQLNDYKSYIRSQDQIFSTFSGECSSETILLIDISGFIENNNFIADSAFLDVTSVYKANYCEEVSGIRTTYKYIIK